MTIDINMVLTVFMWVFSLLIFISNRKSSTNRWCSLGIIIFSLGGLKEYFLFSLAPSLAAKGVLGLPAAEKVYSVLTAILYYMAMPAVLIFVLYFCNFNQTHPRLLKWIKRLLILPCVVLMLAYPPDRTRDFQLSSPVYWYVAAAYNLSYGIFVTVIMFRTLLQERNPALRKQKRLVSMIAVPPIWYWLITIFVIHALQLKRYFKLWQGNLFIIVLLLLFYICMAFREGMMGLKLNGENYQWDSDVKMINKGAHYTSHILKNELYKIKWCIANLRKKWAPHVPEEVEIISDSAEHLSDFIEKTRLYSNDITLNRQSCPVKRLIEKSLKGLDGGTPKVVLDCKEDAVLYCDPLHTAEVLNNLVQNASEAIQSSDGVITIAFDAGTKHRYDVLAVSDTGVGMTRREQRDVFNPYHTTKTGGTHFGLGLYYCYNVLNKHGGFIKVTSSVGVGSTFSLYFPKVKSLGKRVCDR